MDDQSTPFPENQPLSRISGAAKRRRRAELGLPRYSGADMASRARAEAKRSKRRAKAKYDQKRAYVDAIKIERGCTDCGYRNHPAALEFDHLPGTIKIKTIAQMCNNTSMAKLRAEIAKCEVVCANCHVVRTSERRRSKS